MDFHRAFSLTNGKETWEMRRIFDSNHFHQAKFRANLVINDE